MNGEKRRERRPSPTRLPPDVEIGDVSSPDRAGAKTLGSWAAELEGADVVIGLAGRSVNCRYTAANRREILTSRVDSTLALGQAIAWAKHPPRTWL
ncbi:MAG: hypothetical protein M3N49_15480, partial [Candidatus Eremiobacteraeota bacterium]|nr:hypothetical protein [Candidatus Eremiobacteraeota bacterium]